MNLQRVTDVLHISLFDEVIIDILQVGVGCHLV